MEKGKIYSFVGPARGGKSYAASEVAGRSFYDGVPCIEVDFSDGIREVVNVAISGKITPPVDVKSEYYSDWKKSKQSIVSPNGEMCEVDGRTMLKNVGEFLKDRVYNEIWANWALNLAMNQYYKMNMVDRTACNIIFGSLRFEVELKAIIKCAELTQKKIEIRFCNHFNKPEICGAVHPSEELAQRLIHYGVKDGDIVNDYFSIS